MFRIRPQITNLVFLGVTISLLACTPGNEKSRPSPPASDSIVMNNTKLSINYSTPGVKKRKIWGELVPHGEVWRTGANKATVFETSGDIKIEDKPLSVGKYSMFTITTDTTWTIIFNEEWDQWGAYNYDEAKDVLRLKVTPRKSDYTERMTFTFTKEGLRFEWENLYYLLEIEPKARLDN